MSEKRSSDVLGGLPNSRPHRRSAKRAARPGAAGAKSPAAPESANPPKAKTATKAKTAAKATAKPTASTRATPASRKPATQPRRKPPRLQQPKQPSGVPEATRPRASQRSRDHDLLGTVVQAAAELAEIGVTVGIRALRGAASKLPRP